MRRLGGSGMRSAGFWAGTAGALFAVLAVSAPSLAQQYVPAQVNMAKVTSAAQPASAKSATGSTAAPAATAAVRTAAAKHHPVHGGSNAPQVFLLKGLADVFSSGLDKL